MSGSLAPDPNATPQPGFFDQLGNIGTNPGLMSLIGAAGGFGRAAMPTPYRGGVPFGAALASAAQGMGAGAGEAYKAQQQQAGALGQQITNVSNLSALPVTVAQNRMLAGLYNNPDAMKSMMDGFGGSSPEPGTASSSSPSLMGNAFSSIADPKLRTLAFNTAISNGMSVPEAATWVSAGHNESSWNPNVPDNKNSNGTTDVGLMGINSSNFGKLGLTAAQLRDPATNLAASAKLFHQAWTSGGGDPAAALTGYNAGSPTATPSPGYVPNGMSRLAQWGYGGATQDPQQMFQYYSNLAGKAKLMQRLGVPVPIDPTVYEKAAEQWSGVSAAGPTERAKAANSMTLDRFGNRYLGTTYLGRGPQVEKTFNPQTNNYGYSDVGAIGPDINPIGPSGGGNTPSPSGGWRCRERRRKRRNNRRRSDCRPWTWANGIS